MSEEVKDEQIEEVVAEPKPDKPVEQSQFNKYREAFLRQELGKLNVKDGAEMDAAITFIEERADESDSNLDEVFHQIKVRMRLDQRTKYVDPSPMNGQRWKPTPVDGQEIGRQLYQRLKKGGKIR